MGAVFGACDDEDSKQRDASVYADASGGVTLDAAVDGSPPRGDAGAKDVAADGALADARAGDAGAGDAGCNVGTAQNNATSGTLDLFGAIVYFNNGGSLPAGTYQATYLGGCMKYASDQGWAVHAYAEPGLGWYAVGNSSDQRLAHLPGAVGYSAYPVFADCVAAGLNMPAVQFQHAGGKIGVWLYDTGYGDNLPGPDGNNPKWRLSRLGVACAE